MQNFLARLSLFGINDPKKKTVYSVLFTLDYASVMLPSSGWQ